MISAKKASKMTVEGGIFSITDYLSRLNYINENIRNNFKAGQNYLDITMSCISRPTYLKVIQKMIKKGFKVTEKEKYSFILSQGHLLIEW